MTPAELKTARHAHAIGLSADGVTGKSCSLPILR